MKNPICTKLASTVGLLILVVFLASANAGATTIDLTTTGASGTINGAIFEQIVPQGTGTGSINSFVEIGGNTSLVEAYNTTVNNVLDNGSSDTFNHQLLLSEVPIVNIGGADYYQFMLDVNQTGVAPLESLDEIQVFTSSIPNQSVETFTGGVVDLNGTLVWRLDDGADNWIKLDYSLNGGSGSGDMFFYLPTDSISGTYVYLYSRFGENFGNNDGFEEWAVLTAPQPIPEPATVLLLGAGLVGVGFFVRRRKTN